MNFPMIGLGRETKLQIRPTEPDDSGWGFGFSPFVINMGNVEAPPPSIQDIRSSVEELFNNACKPKIHTKFKTWKESVALGTWEAVDPSYVWPSRDSTRPTTNSEEG